jgi:aspartate aminotransferase-like enzyme
MRVNHRVENGSFGQRLEELVPRVGLEIAALTRRSVAPPKPQVILCGTAAYRINQYLFDRSRH